MPAGWRRHLHRLAAAVGVAAGAATLAGAADLTNTWEVGGHFVYTLYANGSEIDDAFGYGVRGGYHFKNRHAVELTVQFGSSKSTLSSNDTTFDLTKWSIDYVHDLKVKKPESKIAPYLTFGTGKFIMKSDDGSNTDSVLAMGGGMRYALTPRFSLRFDGKLWHYHGGGGVVPSGHWFAFDWTAGVAYFFGVPKT